MRAVFVLAVACMMSLVAAPGNARADDIQDILALTGLSDQLERIPVLIQTGLASHQNKHQSLSSDEFDRLTQSVAHAYSRDVLYRSIQDHLKKHYDHDRFTTLQFLLLSPIATKMSQLEQEAPTSHGPLPINEYTDYVTTHPPDQERLRLVLNLYEIAKMEELSIHLQTLTLLATLQAFDTASQSKDRLTEKQLAVLALDIKRQLTESLDNVAAVIYLYTYRTASDDELGQYIQLHQSRTILWFQTLLMAAVNDAMATAATTVKEEMASGNKKSPSEEAVTKELSKSQTIISD